MSARPTAETKGARARRPKPGPSEIAPGVFVGGWKDAVEFTGARFCVLDEAPDELAREMPGAAHIRIYDDRTDRAIVSNLDRLADGVRGARSEGKPVLVFCGHGVRRSPLGGAWYLHRAEQLSLEQAYERVRAVRPKVEHAREWIGNPNGLG